VVELVEVREGDGDNVTLVPGAVEGSPLGEIAVSHAEAAGILVVVATTIADLHDIGVAHGALDLDHVVVGQDGRPVLIGFDRATFLEGNPRDWPTSPPARADVDALGRLAEALGATPAVSTLAPGRHRWRGGRRGAAGAATALGEPARGPSRSPTTARAFADWSAAGCPGAHLPGRHPPSPVEPDGWLAAGPLVVPIPDGSRRLLRWGGALLVACTLVLLTRNLLERDRGRPARSRAQTAPVASPTPPPNRPGAAPTLPTSPHPAVPVSGPVALDNGLFTNSGVAYAVGRPGDVVAAGRFTCAGVVLAVLRPATSQLWYMPAWPTAGHPVTGTFIEVVPGGRSLTVRPAGTCDALLIGRFNAPAIDLHLWQGP
jgi:hypothetical protein